MDVAVPGIRPAWDDPEGSQDLACCQTRCVLKQRHKGALVLDPMISRKDHHHRFRVNPMQVDRSKANGGGSIAAYRFGKDVGGIGAELREGSELLLDQRLVLLSGYNPELLW
ncbi:MAG TPA: hypothetical protein VKK81_27570 [Candidatus Binatia bacterium]|nr:hypothetical protein [Candidatus Binatia bacterium]